MGCLGILALIGLLLFGGARASTVEPLTVDPLPGFTTVTISTENATPDQLQAAVTVLQTRLATLSISDATVTVTDEGRGMLSVRLPSVDDLNHLFSLLAAPGYLELVDMSGLENAAEYQDLHLLTTGQVRRDALIPGDALLNPLTGKPFKTIIDGTMVTATEVLRDPQLDQWIVQITFDEAGTELLADFTGAHVDEPLGIVIDGKVISAPTIAVPISGGIAVIQGDFTEQQARALAAQIGSGPLPIRLSLPNLN